ncbi:MAG: PEP-CTERM sorting domain-containing protein [Phycisphaerales bacterium]
MARFQWRAAGLIVLWAGLAQAAMIQIQLGGVDIQYTAQTIMDHSPDLADPDPLTNATFLVDGAQVGVVNTGVTLNMTIPGVMNIPVGGGTVNSAAGGTFDLSLGGGDYLSLTLEQTSVTYIPVYAQINFVFAGAAAAINGQQLPFVVSIGDPVSITFSTQVVPNTITTSGGYLTGFLAAGTGEIQGVPEPATLGLLAVGGVALLSRRRR